jgi:ribonuclease-3
VKPGYHFSDQCLYQRALTHKSAGAGNNERLEFLGDAILNFIIAEAIYHRFPDASEGEMTRLRALLVRQESLADIARNLNLGEQLSLGSGEMKSGGHRRESILADALEALVAAIYLDSDRKLETCKNVVHTWFSDRLEQLSLGGDHRDNKTRLQEWLQARQLALPCYTVMEESGADNERVFKVQCLVADMKESVVAEGLSKKQAEQMAAGLLLEKIAAPGQRSEKSSC